MPSQGLPAWVSRLYADLQPDINVSLYANTPLTYPFGLWRDRRRCVRVGPAARPERKNNNKVGLICTKLS